MSYILDALRRADAERERGAVPSLHAQQQFALGDGDGESEGRPKLLWWLAAGLAAVLIAASAWIWLAPAPKSTTIASAPAPVQPVTPAPPAATPPAPAAAPPTPTPAPSTGGITPAPQAAPPSARAPTEAPRPTRRAVQTSKTTAGDDRPPAGAPTTPGADARAPSRSEARTTAPTGATDGARRTNPSSEPAPPRDASQARPAGPETRRVAEPPKGAEPADGRIVPQRELPEDVRRALPNYKVGGSVYSSDPSSRMLMINGQIFREGDAVAAGLVLSQIRRKSAVFEFRGYRYEAAF